MSPKTIRGFAVVYALLFLVVIGSGLGAYAAYNIPAIKHDVKVVKQSLGDQNLTRLTDEYVRRIAGAQGFAVDKLLVLKVVTKGDAAYVTVKATVVDAYGSSQTVTLLVTFKRGVWNATGAVPA